jgi:hypothetical protein
MTSLTESEEFTLSIPHKSGLTKGGDSQNIKLMLAFLLVIEKMKDFTKRIIESETEETTVKKSHN